MAVRSAILVLLAFVLLPGATSAHAQLVALAPPDGTVLSGAPSAVTLTFNETVGLATGGLRVLDWSGAAGEGRGCRGRIHIRRALPSLPDG